MRAVVDNPEVCAIKGLSPNLVTAASWALGSSLAGLAAILIAPGLNLEVNTLSLLVVAAYACAVVGRLQSLPLTFAGALVLGVAQAMIQGYLPSDNEFVQNLRPALPFVLLFGALLLRRETRLPERVKTHTEPSPPPARSTWLIGAAAVAAAIPDLRAGSPTTSGSSAPRALVFAAIVAQPRAAHRPVRPGVADAAVVRRASAPITSPSCPTACRMRSRFRSPRWSPASSG